MSDSTPEPWTDERMLRQEIEWAHQILDGYGAPRTLYNYYDHEDVTLNLPGRILIWLNPKNESGWKVTNENLCKCNPGGLNEQ